MDKTKTALPIQISAAARPFASDLVRAEVPAGGTVLEILTAQGLLRQACEATVWIDDWCIPRDRWHCVRPQPGRLLSVRVLPAGGGGGGAKNALRIVAAIAVVYSAYALAGPVASALFAAPTAAATAATTAALASAGMLALNMLIPPPKASSGQMQQRYSIGASNNASPYGPVPVVLGRHRWAPPYAAKPYTEVIGEDQYVRILFDLGPGPLEIDTSSMRLGDTPLSDYSDVEIEVRQGYAGDAPLVLFPGTVEELSQGAGLPQGVLRQQDGWITRIIDQDADEIGLDFVFPTGVWRMTDKGNRKPHQAAVECQYAPEGSSIWTPFPTGASGVIRIQAETDNSPIRRGARVAVARGRYQVRVRRLIDNDGDSKYSDAVSWTAARAVLNTAPLSTRIPHALVALRIRATGQLNGAISDFNVVTTRICPDYDAASGTWVERATRNPASAFLWVARGPANMRPAADGKIDWDALEAWHQACAAAGYTYDAVLSDSGTVYERLKQIAAVGRAQFQVRDAKYSVVRDVPQDAPVTVITPRNSWGFKFTRTFADIPHALRCRFVDQDSDYETVERVVYDDGYSAGNASLYEVLDLPGVTSADQAYKAGRYHLAQLRLRPSIYELYQDVESLIVRRGDRVDVQHDVMLVGLSSGRIKAISADRLTLTVDEACVMEAGKSYAVRIRHSQGVTEIPVATVAGEQTSLSLSGTVPAAVQAGDLFAFGEAGKVTVPLLVKGIYPGADLTAKLELVDLAPAIHQADTGTIPPYDPGITTSRLPTPTGFNLSADLVMEGGAWVTQLSGRWNAMHLTDSRIDGYVLQLRNPAGDWITITPDTPTSFRLISVAQGVWQGRLWAVSADGRKSSPAEAAVTVSVETAATVTNIRTDGTWSTPDLVALWDCTLDTSSPYFGGFRVQVLRGSTVLTTQIVQEQRFAYAYSSYAADAAAAGVSVSRSLTLSVQLLDATGDPVGAAETAILTNPAHVAVGTAAPQFLGINVDATTATVDPDFIGLAVWVSDTPGINPSANAPRLFDGRKAEVVPLDGNIPVYVRWAARDVFGWDVAYVSTEVALLPELIDTEQLAKDAVGRDNLSPELRQPIDLVPILDAARQAVDRDGIEQARALVQSIVAADENKDAIAFAQQVLETRVEEGISAVAEMTTDLVAQVEDTTAIVQQQAQAIADIDGTVSGMYTVKIQTISGGTQVVSGFGLTADATGSAFGVLADRFYIAAPGQPGKYPFAVETDPVTGETTIVLNGVTYAGQINANQITAGKLAAGLIDANELSAISANLGTITSGRIQNSTNTMWLDFNSGSFRLIDPMNGSTIIDASGLGVFIASGTFYNNATPRLWTVSNDYSFNAYFTLLEVPNIAPKGNPLDVLVRFSLSASFSPPATMSARVLKIRQSDGQVVKTYYSANIASQVSSGQEIFIIDDDDPESSIAALYTIRIELITNSITSFTVNRARIRARWFR